VDIIVGPQSYHRLPELCSVPKPPAPFLTRIFQPKANSIISPRLVSPKSANAGLCFVTVQEGCDKFCTFCVVPYTRGAEVSRPVEGIVAKSRC